MFCFHFKYHSNILSINIIFSKQSLITQKKTLLAINEQGPNNCNRDNLFPGICSLGLPPTLSILSSQVTIH